MQRHLNNMSYPTPYVVLELISSYAYPNPAKDYLTVHFANDITRLLTLKLPIFQ